MRVQIPFLQSLRWRLPLTYAAIAMIAALALGVVLLTTLRSYYAQAEWNYLFSNAQATRRIIHELENQQIPREDIQAQLQNIAFLAQVRVQWLDENHNLVSDSGIPDNSVLSIARPPGVRVFNARFYDQTAATDSVTHLWFSSATPSDDSPTGTWEQTFTIRQAAETTPPAPDSVVIAGTAATATDFTIPVRRTLFGFNLFDPTRDPDSRRSDQSIVVPLSDSDLTEGYVQLSHGPAYGLDIVDGVARMWLIASVTAVILATMIGLYISRRLSAPLLALAQVTVQMSEGDLTARAAIEGQDEIGILARSFNEMAYRVEETILTLRRFVADAAHELHTPLTALRTNMELLTDEERAEQRSLFLQRAQAQVNRLETLTNDLLELSRLEANSKPDHFESFNLSGVIRETSELYASQAEQADIEFRVELPAEDLMIRANESQLRRALGNLLENALKFTPPGGMVAVGLQKREALLIELWVQDTGIGIPDDDLPQLFSRFHRGRNAFAYPGSGLGLAIVKAIADAHGGSVCAENRTPGTRFTLRLPA